MIMRVLIVGGLGYIGSELIENYKKSDEKGLKVDIVDKNFVPHILAGLDERFTFYNVDMKDSDAMAPVLEKKPDVVFMLAAEVQAESSVHREQTIWENNFVAIVRVIEKCPEQARIVFPSTGNVFGGVNEDEKYMNLTEEDAPKPKYPYAESKHAVEKYLRSSGKNYTVCRFGTNYGFSPGIRLNLVTNNFIKKALTGETIVVHGSGENYRPTLCVKDSARALLFLAECEKAKGEIFHVVSGNFKIKELAQKACTINPSVKVEHIAKEVPFSSYHLSSDKIQKVGFKFEWNIDRVLEDMQNVFTCIR